jgi:uncharacterized protein (TIGR02145 family)
MNRIFWTGALAAAVLVGCSEQPDTNRTEPQPGTTEYKITVAAGAGGRATATIDGEKVSKAVAGAEITLTATPDAGCGLVMWSTEGVVLTAPDAVSTTFRMPAGDVSLVARFISVIEDEGVVINGLKWATRNLDAPGMFTTKPEKCGMYYQWNRPTAWTASLSSTPAGAQWDSSYASGNGWAAENDPSPEGWRVPTRDELELLVDPDNVTNEWVEATADSPAGRRFTDKKTNKSLFIPVSGGMAGDTGEFGFPEEGYFWTSSPAYQVPEGAYFLTFDLNQIWPLDLAVGNRAGGFPVRPVSRL